MAWTDITGNAYDKIEELEDEIEEKDKRIQEYHNFLESLCDFLIWDTSKRARDARYKIETFLKRMDNKE